MKNPLFNIFKNHRKQSTINKKEKTHTNVFITIAGIGVILTLLIYKISNDLSSSITMLVATILLLVSLTIIFNSDKPVENVEEAIIHFQFLTNFYSFLLAGYSCKKSLQLTCDLCVSEALKENVQQAIKTQGKEEQVKILFNLNSKDRIGFEIGDLLNNGISCKIVKEEYLKEFSNLYEEYKAIYIKNKKDISVYLYSLNFSVCVSYLAFFMYEAIVNL
jgi:amino acid transporter